MSQEYLSVNEIAKMLKISRSAVTLWIFRKGLAATKLHGRWQVKVSEFERFYAEHRTSSPLRGHFITAPEEEVKIDPAEALNSKQVAKILGVTIFAVNHWLRNNLLKGFRQPNGYWMIRRSDLEHFLKSYDCTERKDHILYVGEIMESEAIRKISSEFGCEFSKVGCDRSLAELSPCTATLLFVEQVHPRARECITVFRNLKGLKYTPIKLLCDTAMDEDWLEFGVRNGISGVIDCTAAEIGLEIQRYLMQRKFPALGRGVNRKHRLRARRNE